MDSGTTDGAFLYDAFISYSRKDEKFARKLEADLERYRPPKGALADRRRLNIFRDVQDLVGNELGAAIREALRQSRYLIVICSPSACASPWVGLEVQQFVESHGKERVIPVLLSGRPNHEVKPEDERQDQAFPAPVCECLEEPLAADFRAEQHTGETSGHRNTRLNEAKYQVLALLLSRQKEELLQRQRAHRRRVQVTFGAVGVAVFLAMAALTVWALLNAAEARRQARVALSRQLAVQSGTLRARELDLSLLLAVAACSVTSTVEARGALLDALRSKPELVAYLRGPSGPARCVAYSPDGSIVAAGSDDGSVVIWDTESGQPVGGPFDGHEGPVTGVAFSPAGGILASSGDDGRILLRDVADRQRVAELEDGGTCIAFSPDGTMLASGARDGTVTLWDVAGRRPIGTLTGEPRGVTCVAFSPDGSTLAAGCGLTVVLWEVSSRSRAGTLAAEAGPANSLSFRPDGMVLASGHDYNTIVLWDVAARRQIGRRLEGHWRYKSSVLSVTFSPDGRTLASSSDDQTVRLWSLGDVANGRPFDTLVGHAGPVNCVAFSPDGRTLATAGQDNTVILWHTKRQERIREDLAWYGITPIGGVAFSQDGKVLASSTNERTVILWDAATRQPLDTLVGHTGWVNCVAFSPDGSVLASGSYDSTVILWDATTRQQVVRFPCDRIVEDIAFGPNGSIRTSPGGRLLRWDRASRQPVDAPAGHLDSLPFGTFSPDGRTLAATGGSAVVLWDAADRRPADTLRGHGAPVYCAAFSPDGRMLASGGGDSTVILWDVTRRRPLGAPMRGHSDHATCLAFSPDGSMLASAGGFDRTVILWDVASRQPVGEPLATSPVMLRNQVQCVAFSPDGRTLASAATALTLWDVSQESWVAKAKRVANRALTPDERRRYFGAEQRRRPGD